MPVITYREAVTQALTEALDSDERVFIMGEDVGGYGGSYAVTKGMLAKYGPKRIRETPIAESVFVGAGAGAAMAGLKPVVEIMTINFSILAMDQIVNHAAKVRYMSGGQLSSGVIMRTVTGGGAGLAATHSQSLEPWYAHVPGIWVVTPATPYDALGLLREAFTKDDPVLFSEHALIYRLRGEVPEEHYTVPFGQAAISRRGSDVTLVAYSRMVHVALDAAQMLANQGVEAEVIDLRTLRPLDMETVFQSVRKTNRVAVVEEAWRTGGFAAEIASQIQEACFDYLDGPVARIGGEDVPQPYAINLERATIPDAKKVVNELAKVIGLKVTA
ncbi:MAG: alpha-ketoacid dehydrogenase subunit beta [SAR202 cluster bacterium]|nr:alpha-ketoacid dehydrogenase subunit beta [SAR202 cluster bacterium]